jgi:hypothetical protein
VAQWFNSPNDEQNEPGLANCHENNDAGRWPRIAIDNTRERNRAIGAAYNLLTGEVARMRGVARAERDPVSKSNEGSQSAKLPDRGGGVKCRVMVALSLSNSFQTILDS